MDKLRNSFPYISGAFVFSFPLLFLFVDHWGSVIHALFALLVVFYAAMPNAQRSLTASEKRLIWIVAFLIFSLLLTFFLVDQSDFNYSRVRRYGRVLLVIPVLYVLLKAKPDVRFLWYGIIVACALTGVLGLYEWFSQPEWPYRIKGDTNALIFGYVSALLVVLGFASCIYFFRQQGLMIKILPVLAVLLAFIACFLSGARGAWMGLLGACFVFILLYVRQVPIKQTLSILLAAVLVLTVLYAMPQTDFKRKLTKGYNNIKEYSVKKNIHSSWGARIEMWRVAGEIFLENPVLGAGASEFKNRIVDGIEQGQYKSRYHGYSEPHNEYMAALSSRGLVGFISLLLLFGFPLFIFFRMALQRDKPVPAIAGALFMTAIVLLGLTSSVCDMPRTVSFFGFYLAVLMSYAADYEGQA